MSALTGDVLIKSGKSTAGSDIYFKAGLQALAGFLLIELSSYADA
jgi:hypothetical protein